MQSTRTKPNAKQAFWRQRVEQSRNSGLGRRAFCECNGINKSSLDSMAGLITTSSPRW